LLLTSAETELYSPSDVVPCEIKGELNFDFQEWLNYVLFEGKFDAGIAFEEEEA